MKLTGLLLFAVAAFAQLPPKQSVTLALTSAPTASGVKDMTMLARFVGQLQDASYDELHNSITVTGFEHQLGLVAWLLRAVEKPVDNREYVMQPDLPADSRNPVTRVHYLQNADRGSVQEILTIARTVGDIQLAFGISQPAMIAFRGNATQAELGDWVATNLDVPAGTGYKRFTLPPSGNGTEDVVGIFYLDAGMSLHAVLDLREKIRMATSSNKIFNKTSPPAIVIRGTSAVLSQAQQIISQN